MLIRRIVLHSAAVYQFLRLLALFALAAVWLGSIGALGGAAPIIALAIGALPAVALIAQFGLTGALVLRPPAILAKLLDLVASAHLVVRHPVVAARLDLPASESLDPIVPGAFLGVALIDAMIVVFLILYPRLGGDPRAAEDR